MKKSMKLARFLKCQTKRFISVSLVAVLLLGLFTATDIYYDAPAPTQSSEDLAGFLEFFNNPNNKKKYQMFSNLEKELLYYFEKISDSDKKEIIEFTKIKTRKKQ